jgi:4-hydroxy-tetrahydrodipicolinate reductase
LLIRIGLLGASGRMGRQVDAAVDAANAAGATLAVVARVGRGAVGPGAFASADVVIDFSLPEALEAALPHLGSAALVSGTTGLSPALREAVDARAAAAPVLWSANFSTGVAVLRHLVARAASSLPDFDIEITEVHHRLKQDAPSGTALALAEAAAEARRVSLIEVARHGRRGRTGVRDPAEIGIHAIRGGDVVGEHTVALYGDGERIALGHAASSRATFAAGAVRAARWIVGRPPGHYTLNDVLDLR